MRYSKQIVWVKKFSKQFIKECNYSEVSEQNQKSSIILIFSLKFLEQMKKLVIVLRLQNKKKIELIIYLAIACTYIIFCEGCLQKMHCSIESLIKIA